VPLRLIGLVLGKVRPNWFAGITPWTLSNKRAWTRSHRLVGWLFTSLGGITLLLSLLDRAAALFFLFCRWLRRRHRRPRLFVCRLAQRS
jgi:uncharacterized membrane protein